MLVNLKEILALAEKGRYAVPAFNVYNMETVMGVLRAAQELRAPVILQGYSRLFSGEEAYFLAPIVLAAAKQADVPVCFHLDHGAGEREAVRALRYGCTGVMIDASLLPFEENAAATERVVSLCAAAGVPVEGELGHVGKTADDFTGAFTDPDEAAQFVSRTGVAALAVLVGTAHGRYRKAPKLDIERLAAIREKTGVPLVLHGGSGVPDEELRKAIEAGVRKVNFSTDLCLAFLDAVFATPRETAAIDVFMKDAVEAAAVFARDRIRALGAEGRV